MVEQAGLSNADMERRLRLVELAAAQSIAANLEIIHSVKALGLEKTHPKLAGALTQSFERLFKTFQELFEVAAPEAAKVDEGEDA